MPKYEVTVYMSKSDHDRRSYTVAAEDEYDAEDMVNKNVDRDYSSDWDVDGYVVTLVDAD